MLAPFVWVMRSEEVGWTSAHLSIMRRRPVVVLVFCQDHVQSAFIVDLDNIQSDLIRGLITILEGSRTFDSRSPPLHTSCGVYKDSWSLE